MHYMALLDNLVHINCQSVLYCFYYNVQVILQSYSLVFVFKGIISIQIKCFTEVTLNKVNMDK